ncbi:MAG: hypothetical protein WBD99_01380 [Thermodesulfobacteriota bacterium]
MDCGEARKIIYTSDGIQARSSDLADAREHLKNCSTCAEFFEIEKGLKDRLKSGAPKEKATASLREHILSMLADQDSAPKTRVSLPSGRFIVKASLSFLGVVLVLLSITFIYRSLSNKESLSLASRLAEDHLRNIPEAVQISSSDPRTIEDWFSDKVDFAILVPELMNAKLIGGRLCHLDNKRIALLFYEKEGKPISLFVMDESYLDGYSQDKVEILRNKLHNDTEKGCNLIFWRQRGILYALVSDINTEELSNLVPEIASR